MRAPIFMTTKEVITYTVEFWGYSRFDADYYKNLTITMGYDFNDVDNDFLFDADFRIEQILTDVFKTYGKKIDFEFIHLEEVTIQHENYKKIDATEQANEWLKVVRGF